MTKFNQAILVAAGAIAGLAIVGLIIWGSVLAGLLGQEREADFREACIAVGGVPNPAEVYGYDRCQVTFETDTE